MTGPEHYKAAEDLLRSADVAICQFEEQGRQGKQVMADSLTAQAQAHATLALAAATGLAGFAGMPAVDSDAWLHAAGTTLAAAAAVPG